MIAKEWARLLVVASATMACTTGGERIVAVIPEPGVTLGSTHANSRPRVYFVDQPTSTCRPVARASMTAGHEDDAEDLLVVARDRLGQAGANAITLERFSVSTRTYVVTHLTKPDEEKQYEALSFTAIGKDCGVAP